MTSIEVIENVLFFQFDALFEYNIVFDGILYWTIIHFHLTMNLWL